MTSQLIDSMPFADYQAAPGINASVLKIVHQHSLVHARAYLDGTFQKESAALDFGKAFHSLALEGLREFVVRPEVYIHPKDGPKPWHASAGPCKEWAAEHESELIVSAEQEKALDAMHEAVIPHLPANFPSRCEVSVFAERDGLPIKARIDCLTLDDDAPVIDLKTCRNAHPEQFMREALRLGYHLQAAFTLDILRKVGINRNEFRFVAVESEPPHAVCVLRFKDEPLSALRMGRARYRAAFGWIAEATKTGVWSDYGTRDAEEFIPAWYKAELEQTA